MSNTAQSTLSGSIQEGIRIYENEDRLVNQARSQIASAPENPHGCRETLTMLLIQSDRVWLLIFAAVVAFL
jgi:hypothetical protein